MSFELGDQVEVVNLTHTDYVMYLVHSGQLHSDYCEGRCLGRGSVVMTNLLGCFVKMSETGWMSMYDSSELRLYSAVEPTLVNWLRGLDV